VKSVTQIISVVLMLCPAIGSAQTSQKFSLDVNTIQVQEEPIPQSGRYLATDYTTVTKKLLAEPFADNYAVGVSAGSIHFGATGKDSVFYGGDEPTTKGFGASAVPVYTKETFKSTNLPIQMTCQFYSDQDIPDYNESYLFFIPSDYIHFGSPTYYIDNQASQKEGVIIGGRPYQSWVQDTRSASDPSRVLVDVTHNITTNGKWFELSCVLDVFNGEMYVRNVTIDGQPTFSSSVNLGVLSYMNNFRIGFAADDLAYGFKILTNYRDVTADFNHSDTICIGACVDFDNTTEIENKDIPTQYSWTFEGADKARDVEENPKSICYSKAGDYKVTLISYNQFVRDTVTKWTHVKAFERVNLGEDRALCQGDTITLSLNIPNVNFLWSSNSNDSFLKITEPGTYWVRIEREKCLGHDTMTVVNATDFKIDLGEDTLICNGDVFELNAFVRGALSYQWNTNNSQPNIAIKESGKYVVEITGGCATVKDSINVQVDGCDGVTVWIPTAFSPNSDNLNETFKPIITSNSCCQIKSYRFRVYDLWGTLVFETDQQNQEWKGDVLNAVVQQDIYIWLVEFKDVYKSKYFKGEVHVMR
jgi:gliding motility-associated-like protein